MQIVSSANEQASRLGLPPVEPIIVLAGGERGGRQGGQQQANGQPLDALCPHTLCVAAPSGAGVGPKVRRLHPTYSESLLHHQLL